MYPEENEEEESNYDMDDDSLKRKKRSSWGNKDKKQRSYGKDSGYGGSESLGIYPTYNKSLIFKIFSVMKTVNIHYSSHNSSISILIT